MVGLLLLNLLFFVWFIPHTYFSIQLHNVLLAITAPSQRRYYNRSTGQSDCIRLWSAGPNRISSRTPSSMSALPTIFLRIEKKCDKAEPGKDHPPGFFM
jgi:hypothetical protein